MSSWPGLSSALGGLVIEFSGIGGVSPRSAACSLRHRARSQTSVLSTSLIGPKPPAESPYRVEYPVAISLLFPVVSTRCPAALLSPIRITPRIRDCRFSAASPARSSSASKLSTIGAIGTVLACSSCRLARSSASPTECPEEYLLGISTTCTCSGPSASAAMVATSAESIPPDRPRITERKPFFRT